MATDPHDKGAYRMAVAAVGFSLVVALAGVCVILAVNGAGTKGDSVPQQLWTTISALGGGLLGILAPSPTPSAVNSPAKRVTGSPVDKSLKKLGRGLVILGKDIWANRAIAITMIVFGYALIHGSSDHSLQLRALAGASGGLLVGMLAPSPGKKESPPPNREPAPDA